MNLKTAELIKLNALLEEKLSKFEQTEAALRESEERYQLAMAASREGLWDWTIGTSEVYYSSRFKEILGYEDHEFAHEFSAFESQLHPDDHDRVLAAVQAHLAGESPYDIEYRLSSKQGNYLWIRAKGQAIWDESGQPIRMAGSISDITESKQSSAQLHEMTQRLALATSAAKIGVWDYDTVENRLIWDEGMYRLYGINGDSFGGAYEAWKQGVHPDDIEAADADIQAAIAGEKDFHTEFRVVWPNGQVRFIEAHATTLRNEAGKAQRMIGVNWDITERKQMDIQLKNSLKELADVKFALDRSSILAITDSKGRITHVNDRFCDISEYSRAELIGKTHRLVNSGYHPPDFFQHMWQTISSGLVWQGEIKNLTKSGSYYWVHTTIVPILDESGLTLQYVAIRSDITDRKRAEADLLRANERLEAKVMERTKELEQQAHELVRSNEELGKFAYVASHDLQEPLRTISSFVELLVEEYGDRLDGEAHEYVEFIVDGANRMQQLIKDLLTFSRVGTRGQEFTTVDCEGVVKTVLHSLKLAMQESHAKVTYDALPVIEADESQMQQLFQNLIGNALKFRGKEPPHIHISVTQCKIETNSADGHLPYAQTWEFCVRDNGIGIDAEYFDQIFEIFQRLHSRRHYEGTGIGLAICRKIVERHGGRMWVESTPGEGTAFYFTLLSRLPANQIA
ncbi:PAS domain-containing sensor histidine kinase [Leptothoe sp. PORK10 BA2]|uniref:PAS domain-containing sensor histidine kinase n=1 Tax=Leptothoe sp. PORK10 BA2 TaxID=3110254 RepID=UPI002B1E98B4|nr:PAS domain-containing protein [Leptothoe sp. PORK10 BA2]MEA5463803.1 PAS domain-containing protein [Leptothoe sp. PORK10 BA2]